MLVTVESKPADAIPRQYLPEATESPIGKVIELAKKVKRQGIGKVVHYMKMLVVDNLSADTLDKVMRRHIDKDTVIVPDASSSHIKFEEYFKGMNNTLKAMWTQ